MVRHKRTVWYVIIAVVAGTFALAPAAVPAGGNGDTRQIPASGVTSFSPTPIGVDNGSQQPELGPVQGDSASAAAASGGGNGVNRSRSIEHGAPDVSTVPVTAGQGVSSTGPLSVLSTFDGLNHRQQRRANGGNQFTLEPPDQGLCVGNGLVMEIINDVMRVYNPDGTAAKGVEDLNTFFGYPPAIIRGTPNVFGQFVTDPSCYFDKDANRWFADVLTIDTFPKNDPAHNIRGGDFTGTNHLDLAVSQTSDPTGSWTIYRIPVQDDGTQGTPNHHCTGIPPFGQATTPTNPNACLGDYPHLGADANGIYLTTNEYSFFGNDFHGAQVYAVSKQALKNLAATVAVTQFDTHGADAGNSGFTIWPATAPAGLNSTANGGTEFFMSSNAADEAHGNGVAVGPRRSDQLLVWSLTNTSSLNSSPTLTLSHKTLTAGLYVVPARSEQKNGETPLIDCLNKKSCATNFVLGVPDPFAPEHEYALDSNDTRMQQVVFAAGKLWGALDTAVNSSANTRAGVEWFVVNPSAAGGPALVNSGYLAVSQNNVTYPAIAVTKDGNGVMAFTLVGRDFFPSAAFASITADGVGAVQVAAQGIGPADGFTGTAVFNDPNPARPRWGDYGAAVVDGNNNIWMASEYIGQTCTLSEYVATGASCGGTRTLLANWDTRITEVNPAG
ncbi:MAG: hypothetical protein AUH32_03625 [Actinobacteria bacterium 13_1_40CM_66_12]|nr:MAG: hypothetical protein AUH32_03625 [Actinobacteria bacterium 13_1_40CM_66_12]